METAGEVPRAVRGNWNYGDNLAEFNRLTGQGVAPAEAASRTFTGTQAQRFGHTNVTIEEMVGVPGNYRQVTVLFE